MADKTYRAIVDLLGDLNGRVVPRDLNKAMRRFLVPDQVQRWIRTVLRQPRSRLVGASEFESHIAEIATCLEIFEEKSPSVVMYLYLLCYEAHRNGSSCLDKSSHFEAKLSRLARKVGVDQGAVDRCFRDKTNDSATS